MRPPIYVLHKMCVIAGANYTGNESRLRRDGATTAAEGTLRSPLFEPCRVRSVIDAAPGTKAAELWRPPEPFLQAFPNLLWISLPKKNLAVLWDCNGYKVLNPIETISKLSPRRPSAGLLDALTTPRAAFRQLAPRGPRAFSRWSRTFTRDGGGGRVHRGAPVRNARSVPPSMISDYWKEKGRRAYAKRGCQPTRDNERRRQCRKASTRRAKAHNHLWPPSRVGSPRWRTRLHESNDGFRLDANHE